MIEGHQISFRYSGIAILLLTLVLLFQNCGKAFKAVDDSSLSSSAVSFSLISISNGSSQFTNQNIVNVRVQKDGVSKWCLTEDQSDPETACVWMDMVPVSFTLSSGEGIKNVFLWTKNSSNKISTTSLNASINLDQTLPNITVTGLQPFTNAVDLTFNISGTDSGAGVDKLLCIVDLELPKDCSATLEFKGVAPGSHALQIKAIDKAGNERVVNQSFVVDRQAPTVTIASGPNNPTNATTASVVFQATDLGGNLDRSECSIDNGAFSTCTTPATYSNLAAGGHTFRVRALDKAGNRSNEVVFNWIIDLAVPTLTLNSNVANVTREKNVSFTFTSNAVNLMCALDAAAFAPCTSPVTFTNLAEGAHVFRVRATNAAGSSTVATSSWSIDSIVPTIAISANPTDPSIVTTATFQFSANDTGSGVSRIECSLDGGPFSSCASPQQYTTLSEARHTFSVRAVDNAANVSAAVNYSWTVSIPVTKKNITVPVTTTTAQLEQLISDATNFNGTTILEFQSGQRYEFIAQILIQNFNPLNDPKRTLVFRGIGTQPVLSFTSANKFSIFRINNSNRVVFENLLMLDRDVEASPTLAKVFHAMTLCLDYGTCSSIITDQVRFRNMGIPFLVRNTRQLVVRRSTLDGSNIGILLRKMPGDFESEFMAIDSSFRQMVTYGIFGPLANSVVIGNTFSQVGQRGIYPDRFSDNLWIHRNTIDQAGTGGVGAGINLGQEDLDEILVSNNTITNSGRYTSSGPGYEPVAPKIDDTIENWVSCEQPGAADTTPLSFKFPNNFYYWNGYGISTSGATNGVIAIVGNNIQSSATYGILIDPNSEKVFVDSNSVTQSGINGIFVAAGYPYEGQVSYDWPPRAVASDPISNFAGPIKNVTISFNLVTGSGRAGIELMPRGKPIAGSGCAGLIGDPTQCPYFNKFILCGNFRPGAANYVPAIAATLTRWTPTGTYGFNQTPASASYQGSFQTITADLNSNTLTGNTQANLIVGRARYVDATSRTMTVNIQNMGADKMDIGRANNIYLFPQGDAPLAAIPGGAVTIQEGPALPSINLNSAYLSLRNRLQQLTVEIYSDTGWNPRTALQLSP